jgi:branched-chain amino acid aminotransferase
MNENFYIWLDGNFIKHGLNITSELNHKNAVFDSIRVYNGKFFKLKQHIKRLFHSAKVLLMDHAFSIDNIEQACISLVTRNNIKDGYIKPLIYLSFKQLVGVENNVHVMLSCLNNESLFYNDLTKNKPLNIQISSLIKPSPRLFPYTAKVSGLNRLNDMAKKRAIDAGYDDALLLDYRGYVSSATASNLFIVKNGDLITPTTECCFNGITRQSIIDIAKASDINVNVRHITKIDVNEADEVFLTDTRSGIKAINSIENKEYKSNPTTILLQEKFYNLIGNL